MTIKDESLMAREALLKMKNSLLKTIDMNWFVNNKQKLVFNQSPVSLSNIILTNLITIDKYLFGYVKKSTDLSYFYFRISNNEWNHLIMISKKADKLRFEINYDNFDYLTVEEKRELLIINKWVIDDYFQIQINKNVNYINQRVEFVNKMNEFGKKHNLDEKELVEFAYSASLKNYDVIEINSQDELERVYKEIYPEM